MSWLDPLHHFLERFIGTPTDLYPSYSLEDIIRYESTHFLFSCCMGWLGLSLIWIILSSRKPAWPAPYTFRFSVFFGLVASFTTHILIDGFTTLA